MTEQPYFSDDLNDVQLGVVAHYLESLNTTVNKMHYLKSQEYLSDLYPIDIVVFDPTPDFNYYTVGTVGLSCYYFKDHMSHAELLMALPPEWKPQFDKVEYLWPIEFLSDISYAPVQNEKGLTYGMVMQASGDGTPYCAFTDAVAAVLTFPEMFPFSIAYKTIENTSVLFLQVVPVSASDLKKIEDMGIKNFIAYDLHDSEDPLMVVKLKKKKPEGIDDLIRRNEDVLKEKTNKKDEKN